MNFMSSGRPCATNNSPSEEEEEEREHMFDKVVTPSDVGKLNRLVIPKQHAERYFPLDSATHDKGLLLNFEDRNGKPWRFRYSYWNSSQSYVMTKGWSRFVKEKKLDAGDIVSFHRGKDRLFIDWRRRPPDHIAPDFSSSAFHHRSWAPLFLPTSRPTEYSRFLTPHPPYANNNYRVVNGNPCPPPSIVYLRSGGDLPQFSGGDQTTVFNAVPVVQGKAAAKRLRLFGVNMDCPIDDDILTSTTLSHHPPIPFQFHPPATPPPPFHDYSSPSSSAIPRPDDKGKGSMSLDLDI